MDWVHFVEWGRVQGVGSVNRMLSAVCAVYLLLLVHVAEGEVLVYHSLLVGACAAFVPHCLD